ncbi:MAG: Nif3-like dinuclear metal center hexameric protein [Gemmatimonadota bacterium]
MTSVALGTLVTYLNELLRVGEIPDDPAALNGLQVECRGPITRIIAAVDASQATIDGVLADNPAAEGSSLILVHHGLFWDGNQPLTGRRYRRLSALIAGDTALYSAHIPLDIHPELGNNILLARALDLEVDGWFGGYKGINIGVRGRLRSPLPRERLVARLAGILGIAISEITAIPGGTSTCHQIGIITGAASRQLSEAAALGLDTFITGEGPHHSYFDSMEGGINLIYGGHYATEKSGVEALARHLGQRFGLPWSFHDHPTGF